MITVTSGRVFVVDITILSVPFLSKHAGHIFNCVFIYPHHDISAVPLCMAYRKYGWLFAYA